MGCFIEPCCLAAEQPTDVFLLSVNLGLQKTSVQARTGDGQVEGPCSQAPRGEHGVLVLLVNNEHLVYQTRAERDGYAAVR
jgi:hypothetical protein